jgi:hypothetical protein
MNICQIFSVIIFIKSEILNFIETIFCLSVFTKKYIDVIEINDLVIKYHYVNFNLYHIFK